uniref:C2H2-type domain-containing protein n=2 Tax=Timema TaxID=61471 RepID=A0A7R9G7P6_TIMSH|nr:unnamed protein product [Timema shepardi]
MSGECPLTWGESWTRSLGSILVCICVCFMFQFTPVVTPSTPSAVTTTTRNNMRSSSAAGIARRLSRSSPKATATLQEMNERHNFHTDFIHPDDIVEHRNGSVYIKHLRCRACNYKAAFEWEIARHEGRVHGMVREVPPGAQKTSVKKVPRPIPNLIRIQSKATPAPSSTSSPLPILRIPTVRGRVPAASLLKPREPQMSDKDLNEICAKSCPNSFLKDFASLIGDEDAFKTSDPDKSAGKTSPPAAFKRKNASFFDQLKEKLGAADNLVCTWCGHESKCLSELVRHQKLHTGKAMRGDSSTGGLAIGAAELSSTRCQHCRHRCKTSADLVVHLQSCEEAKKNHEPSATEDQKEEKMEDDELPVENKVFVWNELPQPEESRPLPEDESESPPDSLAAVETTPDFQPAVSAVKKVRDNQVFKCPHCSFWASTASRFHVHIVGHLNKKPFECSLCAYRSNWRWDITKHIRLKSARDAGHERARVLMTDETGRRNYSKYNKYLTLMRVHEVTAESSGTGRRSRGVTEGSQGRAETPPLRPPPSLLPAQEGPEERKELFPEGGEENPPDKRTSTEGRKTLWKCKKCNYR